MQAFGSRSGVASISPASPSPAAYECLAAAQAGGRGWSWPLAFTLSALSCWSRWRLVTLVAAGRSRSAGSRFRPSRPRPCTMSGHGREADGRQPGHRSGAHSSPRPAYSCSRSGTPRRAHMSRTLAPDHLSPDAGGTGLAHSSPGCGGLGTPSCSADWSCPTVRTSGHGPHGGARHHACRRGPASSRDGGTPRPPAPLLPPAARAVSLLCSRGP